MMDEFENGCGEDASGAKIGRIFGFKSRILQRCEDLASRGGRRFVFFYGKEARVVSYSDGDQSQDLRSEGPFLSALLEDRSEILEEGFAAGLD